jgi:hypothetical protein
MLTDKFSAIQDPNDVLMIFDKIFSEREGHEIAFTSNIESREIICPIDYVFDSKKVQSLIKAARLVGDRALLLSLTERGKLQEIDDWLIPFDNIDKYTGRKLSSPYVVLENAIYSPTNKWGVWFSIASFAIIGGNIEFTKCFFDDLNMSAEESLRNFIKRYGTKKTRSYLIKLFGYERAITIIETNS